jgi:cytoskeletal protein CcmA (bactofilin family)
MRRKNRLRWFCLLCALCFVCAFCGLSVLAETKEVYDGDLMVADTGLVLVDQTVEGDLLGAAMEMRVTGDVKGSIRAVANSLTLSGKVERNVTVAAVELRTAETLQAEDVIAIATLAEIKGSFESLSVYATQVVIAGHITGELVCEADQVIILEGATFGSAKILSQNEPVVVSDLSLQNWKALSESSYKDSVEYTRTASDLMVALASLLYTLPASLLAAFAAVWLMKRGSDEAAGQLRGAPVRFLLKGVLTFLAFLFGSVLLVANTLTMTVGGVALLVFAGLLVANTAIASAVLGRVLFRKKGPYLGAALVTVILSLLSVLPLVSLILFIPTAAITFGTVRHLLFGKKSPRNTYGQGEPDFRL